MPLVEKRYAEALLELNIQSGEFYEFINGFKLIADIYTENEDFRNFLLNPRVCIDVKYDVVRKVFKDNVRPELINYIDLLLEKSRIKYLPGIYSEYIKFADKYMNTMNITIISASPLEDAHIDLIKEKYKKLHKSTHIKANIEIDKKILGGIKIKIGDKLTDGSVKGRLESLRKILIEE